MRKTISTITLLTLMLGGASAAEPVARLKHAQLKETFQEEAPVSGRVVAGVTVAGRVSDGTLSVIPPESVAGDPVCVQVMSRDGRYWSENTFELPKEAAAVPVSLDYRSQHASFLAGLGFEDLAMLTWHGACAERRKSSLLVSSVGNDGDAAALHVFVNSGRSDTFLAARNLSGVRRPVRCQRIQERRRTAFDTICRLDLAAASDRPERIELRILRRRYERMLPPTELTVLLPPLN